MKAKVQIMLEVELRRPIENDKEADNLADAIEQAVDKLDGVPGLMARVDSAFPGVADCTVVDFTVVDDGS